MIMYIGNVMVLSTQGPHAIGAIDASSFAAKPSLPAVFMCFCHSFNGTSGLYSSSGNVPQSKQ